MTTHHNKYRGLGSGLILREAGVGGSNPLTPTSKTKNMCRCRELVPATITFSSICIHFVQNSESKERIAGPKLNGTFGTLLGLWAGSNPMHNATSGSTIQ